MKYLGLIVLFATLVAGCASTGGYIQSESPDASIVKSSSHRDDWSTWESYRLMAVDDKFLGEPLSNLSEVVQRVEPGTRSLVIVVHFNRGFGTGPFDAIAPLTVTLKPGASYRVTGKITGSTASVWLVDEKLKRASICSCIHNMGKGRLERSISAPHFRS